MNALVPPSDADSAGRRVPPTLPGIHSDPRTGPGACTYFRVIVNPRDLLVTVGAEDTYRM